MPGRYTDSGGLLDAQLMKGTPAGVMAQTLQSKKWIGCKSSRKLLDYRRKSGSVEVQFKVSKNVSLNSPRRQGSSLTHFLGSRRDLYHKISVKSIAICPASHRSQRLNHETGLSPYQLEVNCGTTRRLPPNSLSPLGKMLDETGVQIPHFLLYDHTNDCHVFRLWPQL